MPLSPASDMRRGLQGSDMPDAASIDSAPLPLAYEAWRASELGRITDRIEEELILRLIGPVQGKSVLGNPMGREPEETHDELS